MKNPTRDFERERDVKDLRTSLYMELPQTEENQWTAHRIMQVLRDEKCTIRRARQVLVFCMDAIELSTVQYPDRLMLSEDRCLWNYSSEASDRTLMEKPEKSS